MLSSLAASSAVLKVSVKAFTAQSAKLQARLDGPLVAIYSADEANEKEPGQEPRGIALLARLRALSTKLAGAKKLVEALADSDGDADNADQLSAGVTAAKEVGVSLAEAKISEIITARRLAAAEQGSQWDRCMELVRMPTGVEGEEAAQEQTNQVSE